MSNKLQLRRDTAANWETANPVLLQGEIALTISEFDNIVEYRVGDGTHTWKMLPVNPLGKMVYLYNGREETPDYAHFTTSDKKIYYRISSNAAIEVLPNRSASYVGLVDQNSLFLTSEGLAYWANTGIVKLASVNESLSTLSNEVAKLNKSMDNLDSVVSIPNNNVYTTWDRANEVITRLYIERKDAAIEDGLYIKQMLSASGGFNFGNKESAYGAIQIRNYNNAVKGTCSIQSDRYGLVMLQYDFTNFDWGGLTSVTNPYSTYNINELAYEKMEFDKPQHSILKPLSSYELFSIGDSLSMNGIWQTEVARLTGCTFDQSKNIKSGAALSVGGTKTFGNSFDCGYWRVLNLIKQAYITDKGENAIIILENVNDNIASFVPEARSYKTDNIIDLSSLTTDTLGAIPQEQRTVNTVIREYFTAYGKKLTITDLPTKAGTVTIKAGWSGPGIHTYNIEVVPQSTDEETLNYIVERILEYNFTGLSDSLEEGSNNVIVFSHGYAESTYDVTLEFIDTGNTGMKCAIESTNNARGAKARFYTPTTLDGWSDVSNWSDGITFSSAWKSIIELLQETYPYAKIYIGYFPAVAVTANNFKSTNGCWDMEAYLSDSNVALMPKRLESKKAIADYYNLPLLDVYNNCGISLANRNTYYPVSANVHPNDDGYKRFGKTIAKLI